MRALLIVLLLAACVTTDPTAVTPAMLTTKFMVLAFGSEGPRRPESRGRLVKWVTPLHAAAVHGSERQLDAANLHLLTLAELTDLKVVPSGDDLASFVIVFAPRREFFAIYDGYFPGQITKRWLARQRCATVAPFNERFEYTSAVITVGTDNSAGVADSCLPEEIFQAVGLFEDTDLPPRPSVFSTDHDLTELTVYDRMMVRALYDPRLQPGMTRAEVEPIARRIFAEYLAE